MSDKSRRLLPTAVVLVLLLLVLGIGMGMGSAGVMYSKFRSQHTQVQQQTELIKQLHLMNDNLQTNYGQLYLENEELRAANARLRAQLQSRGVKTE